MVQFNSVQFNWSTERLSLTAIRFEHRVSRLQAQNTTELRYFNAWMKIGIELQGVTTMLSYNLQLQVISCIAISRVWFRPDNLFVYFWKLWPYSTWYILFPNYSSRSENRLINIITKLSFRSAATLFGDWMTTELLSVILVFKEWNTLEIVDGIHRFVLACFVTA